MHAAWLVADRLENVDRIKHHIRPFHHARGLQANDVDDQTKVRLVIGEIAIQRHHRHEVDDVQRIG